MRPGLKWLALAAGLLVAACGGKDDAGADPRRMSWPEIENAARGQRISMHMWMGDPAINAYMSNFVTEKLEQRYGITLELVGRQGNGIVSLLMAEKEAGRQNSKADIVWINGETFYQLRQIDALYGPFTERLPNNDLIRWSDPTIARDFQQPVAGMEAPWGNVQFVLVYDSDRIDEPPRNRTELTNWIKAHPGRFTLPTDFAGMTFLKAFLIDFAGGPGSLSGPFDPADYKAASAPLWRWLEELRPFLWRSGQTFPNSLSQLHQMFANGEVAFSMANQDGEVANKRLRGIFPMTARPLILDEGSIRNTHYLGIPANSAHKAAALVAINFLISPEAQLEKMKPAVWGDGTVLAPDRLDEAFRDALRNIRRAPGMPDRHRLNRKALQEPAPEYMIRLYEDFRRRIITNTTG